MHTEKPNNFIFLLLFLVVLLWGLNVVMLKYLVNYFPPLALAPIRLCMASAFLLPFVVYKEGCIHPPRSSLFAIIGVATFSIFLHQIALSWGISMTSSTHASLILGLNPLLTSSLAGYFMKEPFTPAKGWGILFGFTGVAVVVSASSGGTATIAGDIAMFVATLTFVIGSLFVRKGTRTVSPLIITAYSHSLASLGLLVTGCLTNQAWFYPGALEPLPLAVLLFSSLGSTALGALWWNTGIQQIGAATASLFLNGTPITGVFAAAIFLGEELNWTHYTALLLVILGVSLGTGIIGKKPRTR